MITEMVLLLGFLAFLCIRNDLVRRRLPFLAALFFWGAARILVEANFKLETSTGFLGYSWASLLACTAAACLFFCLLCVFWACLREARGPGSGSEQREEDEDSRSRVGAGAGDSTTTSERIRKLVDTE